MTVATWRFKTREIKDETFSDASKQTHDQSLGWSLGYCKHCSSRRLFVSSHGATLGSGRAGRGASHPDNASPASCFLDDNAEAEAEAFAEACLRTTDYRAPSPAADDTAASGRNSDHTNHSSTGAKRGRSATADRRPVREHVARTKLLQCLLF